MMNVELTCLFVYMIILSLLQKKEREGLVVQFTRQFFSVVILSSILLFS
jgi:hypothetical protein